MPGGKRLGRSEAERLVCVKMTTKPKAGGESKVPGKQEWETRCTEGLLGLCKDFFLSFFCLGVRIKPRTLSHVNTGSTEIYPQSPARIF